MPIESPAGATPAAGKLSDRVFLLLVFVALLLASWIRPLTVPDEGRYADVGRWMVIHHDWLIPRLDGLPFFHKPPLLYWIDACLFSVFGSSPQVARIAPVLAATLCCAGLLWFLRRHADAALARLAVIILATSTLFFGGSQYVNHDLLVATWIALATMLFADAALTGERRSVFLGYLACGLGFMSKGMIGIALPGLVLLPWLLATRRWNRIPALLNPLGILLLVAVTLPWFLLVQKQFPGFVHYFFIEQQVNRYVAGSFNNKQPWWFYIACLIVSSLPWSLLLAPKGSWQRVRAVLGGDIAGLMLWWIIAIVGFFSIPVSKLAGYVLPVTPPLAVLLAAAMRGREPGRIQRLAAPLFLLLTSTLLFLAAARKLGELTTDQSQLLMAVFAAGALAAVILMVLLARQKTGWQQAATLAAGLWCLLVTITVATADHKNNSHELAIKQWLTPDTELVFYRHYYYDLPFLLDRQEASAVVEDWPEVKTDSWGLELKDGTRFDPVAAQKLWDENRLQQEMHSGRRLLLLVPPSNAVPGLEKQTPVYQSNNIKAYLLGA